MTGRAAYTIEYRMWRSDGTFGWVRELSEIQNDAAGRPARMIGTIQDITEQKSTEQALRESEARLRGFLDHAPFAMYLKDTDLRYQLVNRAVEQFQGMTAKQIVGRTPGEIYPPALAERFMAEDHEVLARGVPVTFEYSDPTMRSYADSLTVRFPIRDAGGRIVAIGGITQDISERKQAERALRDSEARLRAFMDNAPAAIAMKDVERRFVILNGWIESAYGRPASELIGRRSVEIVASEGTRAVDAMEAEVVASGATVMREVYFPERKELPWTFEVKFPVRNSAGETTGIGGIAIDITDRKRAEAERQRTEMLLRSFMDNAPMAMAVKDVERRFVMANAPVVVPYGRTAAGVIGKRTIDISQSEGAKSIDAMEREVTATGRTVAREVHFEDRSVSPWTYEVKFPINNDDGALTAIGGIALDITDRKRTELALRDSEARLRRAQQQAKLAYWNWQLEADEYAWSPGSGRILGMPDAELPRKEAAFYRRIYADDRDRMRRIYEGVVAGDDRYTAEFRIVRPDGELVWVEEIGQVERDAAGRRVSVAGIIQDITERKQAERALRESESRLRRAQQQARLAYWTWHFATERTREEFHWSPGSGTLLGVADDGMPVNSGESEKLMHPDDLDRIRRLYHEVRAGLDQYTVDYRAIRPDGQVVWVREIGEAVRDADGNRIGVEGTLQDITEQHALEEQLVQSQKMEAIGQLTGGIAHDFNNLLAVILGNLELLGEELPGNASARQKIDAALRSTLRGSDLTHRLLAYARRQPLAPKVTQVNELIRNMRDLVLRPLGPAIDVTFALSDELWPTEIDQAQLETSLLNLVINARDAMPDGGRLVIETANVTVGAADSRHDGGLVPGDYVCIAVGDSGIGMTDTVRARAFDPFFTTKGVGKGTGLGLSMVYGFVKQSGGHVELDSTIGSGTTVRIYLPRAKNATVAAAAA
jgi:PAS domain S-box-containing protein